MTRREIVKRYCPIVKTGSAWNCYLAVGNQGFFVVKNTTRERARWFAKMLGLAIEEIIKEARE
jgi:hypothetical protein